MHYLYWHYFIAPKEIVKIFRNYLFAIWHIFLIGRHAHTLFAPWHRMKFSTERSGGFVEGLGNAVADTYFRFAAGLVRIGIIGLGLCTEAMSAVLFAVIVVAWFLWPIIIFVSIANIVSSLA